MIHLFNHYFRMKHIINIYAILLHHWIYFLFHLFLKYKQKYCFHSIFSIKIWEKTHLWLILAFLLITYLFVFDYSIEVIWSNSLLYY